MSLLKEMKTRILHGCESSDHTRAHQRRYKQKEKETGLKLWLPRKALMSSGKKLNSSFGFVLMHTLFMCFVSYDSNWYDEPLPPASPLAFVLLGLFLPSTTTMGHSFGAFFQTDDSLY
ncbi:hypothetical protein QN277_003982 [Acacia crassicarpa]|uniref:Transmembrane protein n=1 Tax=Acacia crassicarpa TaxID=499986 RepID=A0AAE1MHY1_9FABA|nr:hypothetical protein QN277_003982 [Acacia crassicarpa]